MFCVIVIKSTQQLAKDRELPFQSFFNLKELLLKLGFTVYEYIHSQARRLPQDRQVILTHNSIRDEAQCTTESVSRISADHLPGQTKFINGGDVSFLNQLQDGVGRPASLRSTSNATSRCQQARCAEQANTAFQQGIFKAKHKRQSAQDVDEAMGNIRHKQQKRSSSNSVEEFHSSSFDAAMFSCREQLNVDFDQSQLMEISSSIETETAFHYTPDTSLSPRNLPPSLPSYRLMEYDEMSLTERAWSMRNSGPQHNQSQIVLSSWSEVASAFDEPLNASPSMTGCGLNEYDELSLTERAWSTRNSGPQQVISGIDQSLIELASWSEIASAFDDPPDVSSNMSELLK